MSSTAHERPLANLDVKDNATTKKPESAGAQKTDEYTDADCEHSPFCEFFFFV